MENKSALTEIRIVTKYKPFVVLNLAKNQEAWWFITLSECYRCYVIHRMIQKYSTNIERLVKKSCGCLMIELELHRNKR